MNFNLVSLLYLFLRLSPFIVVCFFALNSLFNQDFKGLVYLIGLIFSCFGSSMIYSSINPYISFIKAGETQNPVCNLVSFSSTYSPDAIPIGQNILGYTFFFLLYVILKHNLVSTNVPALTFFPILILCDGVWNFTSHCYNPAQIVLALVLGGGFGTLLSWLIDSLGLAQLQYFNNSKGHVTCNRPAKQTFRCNVYKNQQLISSKMM
jgi:hypothetical protein